MMPSAPSVILDFPNYIPSVNLIADLRLASVANQIAGRNIVVDAGITSGDGLGGVFVWNATSTASDDGINVVAPTGVAVGRWLVVTRQATTTILPPIDTERSVTNKTTMSALDVTIGKRVNVIGELAGWQWQTGSFTAQVASDPSRNVYQPHATIPVTTGCWVLISSPVNSASTKADVARNISTTGLASGGGTLAADRNINVTKATSADVLSGTADDRAITPLALRASIAGTYSAATNGYVTLGGGIIMQWGQVRTPITATNTVTFPIAFPNACFSVTNTAQNTTGGSSSNFDAWTQNVSRTNTTFTITMQSSVGSASIDGFDWIAFGN